VNIVLSGALAGFYIPDRRVSSHARRGRSSRGRSLIIPILDLKALARLLSAARRGLMSAEHASSAMHDKMGFSY